MTTGTELTEFAEAQKNEVALVGRGDALAKYADAVAPQYIVGKMLRFSKGDYLVDKDKIAVGTVFTVDADDLMAGWIKWLNSKPVEHLMIRVVDGIPPKLRTELGDDDTAKWELDVAGQPKDPWQFTNYLPMMDDRGELYTFTTSSRGGIGAIAKMVRLYARHQRRHPDVFPVVKLSVDDYQHKDSRLGRIKFPVFEPAGYAPKKDLLAALAEAGFTAAEYPEEEVEPDPADDFNDEVPF